MGNIGCCSFGQPTTQSKHLNLKCPPESAHYNQNDLSGKTRKPQAISKPTPQTQLNQDVNPSPTNKQSFSSEIEVPTTNNVQNYNDVVVLQAEANSIQPKIVEKKIPTLVNSAECFLVPECEQISLPQRSSSFLEKQQQKILESDDMSIEVYRSFSPMHVTNKKGQLQADNLFTCFSRLVFELILANQAKLYKLKNDILMIEQFIDDSNISQSVKDHGEITSPSHIKKLFLEYLVKIINCESAITILQSYYVVSGVLESVLISYLRTKDPEIEIKYFKRQFDEEFLKSISEKLGLQFERGDEYYKFTLGDKEMIIWEQLDDKCAGEIKNK